MSKQYAPGDLTHPLDVVRRAAFIGAASAIPGTTVGAFYGTIRTKTPVLFALISGAQWFAIGTTFWTARTSILNQTGLLNWWNSTRGGPIYHRDDLVPSPEDKIRASTIAGAFTGFSLGFVFRGYRNVIPGTIMFTLFGWAGQHGYNYLDARNSAEIREKIQSHEPRANFMQKLAKSKWSPMTALSDEEYENMLQEKLLQVEAEISIIDDKIADYRRKAKEMETQQKVKDAQTEQKPAEQ
ncbi:hypothetical protein IQ07DRAFT_647591 [Pyrenochaeta sp. DS3sAY3a]|nr:hypothetical protein IQ07DRAFT_647591 [Pyrenochaeta sp. DS3sAY3a]